MQVPFVDLRRDDALLQSEINDAIVRIAAEKNFILGEEVKRFELEFAQFCETEHCVGVGSGTDALKLSLLACNIGQDDEVITVANTFIATVLAISQVGATPVLVDIDPRSYTIDVDKIEQKINKNTKAIIPVHLYGQPAEMNAITALAKKRKIIVIEDACQAHGAMYKGKKTGSIGDVGCFSFYPSKNLGAYGDAGAIVTSNKLIADNIRMLREYGQQVKYHHLVKGTNSRLDAVQAATLRIKLRHLPNLNDQRRKNAEEYFKQLDGIVDVSLPEEMEDTNHVYHLFVIKVDQVVRDQLIEHLKKDGISCGIHYPIPVHLQKAYEELKWYSQELPTTEDVSKRIISLPMFPSLEQSEVRYVSDSIKKFLTQS